MGEGSRVLGPGGAGLRSKVIFGLVTQAHSTRPLPLSYSLLLTGCASLHRWIIGGGNGVREREEGERGVGGGDRLVAAVRRVRLSAIRK